MFLLFLLLWILFNSRLTVEVFIFGAAVSAVCYFISCALFGFSIRKDIAMLKKLPGTVKLLGTLLAEIFKANFLVIGWVYSRKNPEPEFVSFDVSLNTEGAKIALADCITLTPGTITGVLEDSRYTVHCLDHSMADGIENSVFVRQLSALEEDAE